MHRRAELLPIMHPLFNMREVCKHLILLEDHLNQPRKRCPDCISKHFLTIEALLEEAVSLDGGGALSEILHGFSDSFRTLSEQWVDGRPECEVAAVCRAARKEMTPHCFDVRQMRSASVVALRYLSSHFCKE